MRESKIKPARCPCCLLGSLVPAEVRDEIVLVCTQCQAMPVRPPVLEEPQPVPARRRRKAA